MPRGKRSKFYALGSGGTTQTAWTTDLIARIATAGETANVPQSQIDAADTAYQSLIDAGYIPASPASGNGDFALILPFFGTTNIGPAVLAMVGNDVTNNGAVSGDRAANGDMVGDGTFSFSTDFDISSLTNPEYTAIYVMSAANFTQNNGIIGVQYTGSSGSDDRHYYELATALGGINRMGGYTTSNYGNSPHEGTWVITTEDLVTATDATLIAWQNKVERVNETGARNFVNGYPDQGMELMGIKLQSFTAGRSLSTFSMFAILNRAISNAEADELTDIFNTLMTAFGR